MRKGYFEGWYLKQQNGRDTIALIPALHTDDEGNRSASLQIITDTAAYNVPMPADSFAVDRKKPALRVGNCAFSADGCTLDAASDACTLRGALRFGSPVKPRYDIMGPFRFMPFMECRHSVFSLAHRVDGALTLDGREYRFERGTGYIEGDRGASFPRRYVWTQCGWGGNSAMLSAADIPFGALQFVGIVGFVFFEGKEHRIATYCGARPVDIRDDILSVRQGRMLLTARLIRANAHPLRAPDRGAMVRTIHESAACAVRYTCMLGDRTLFDFESDRASFEGHWRDINE